MNKVIGVLGCGWLGLHLAKNLLEQGFTVKGTTTSKDKMDSLTHLGIDSYLIQISESEIKGNLAAFLDGIDFLIINIPTETTWQRTQRKLRT
ncbi:NAD(P)-binding domain-containing protein [Maribacter litopenaei]|uniref:NAD(P)-binding domain-containing protein n=1 Tax=Maribacter litopenaei TaxID=2976127 RepID=A0ABY5Y8A1_9FLAO|nr:NAD(P)-binding domain-containing protein [Maribacter litopenaei]UWX55255.1 NAD(P)-binding domain-containing protein [Maribacter litopenaei]